MCYCHNTFYIYRARSNSITTSVSSSHVKDMIYIIGKLDKYKDKTKDVESFIAFQYATLLINVHLAGVKDKEILKEVYSYRHLLISDAGSVVKLIYICNKFFGIRITSKLLYIYFRCFIKK